MKIPRIATGLLLGAAALLLAAAGPTTPAAGPLRIIGGPGGGCIQGAVRLPDTAEGMQAIRIGKSSFWGAPQTIAALEVLARRAKAAGLPDLYMNDISGPRGGPLVGGHISHQMGLDADVWLDVAGPHPVLPVAARENLNPPSPVRPDGRAVDPALWRPEHALLIKLATELPGIDRVLVNPAIKRKLCESVTGDRTWLRRVRPWWGHASHMHINFVCPAGQPECPPRPPLPAGEGCDASLQWWFDQLDKPPAPPPSHPPPRPKPPAACAAIFSAPG